MQPELIEVKTVMSSDHVVESQMPKKITCPLHGEMYGYCSECVRLGTEPSTPMREEFEALAKRYFPAWTVPGFMDQRGDGMYLKMEVEREWALFNVIWQAAILKERDRCAKIAEGWGRALAIKYPQEQIAAAIRSEKN